VKTDHRRLLSVSEIETALTCWARHDFAYGGRLAGSTLKPKAVTPILTDGKAWGAGVAAWYANSGQLLAAWEAYSALRQAYYQSFREQADAGFPVPFAVQQDHIERLSEVLSHHMQTTEPFPNLHRLEGELLVPIPSRRGGTSNRYAFLGYLDGSTITDDGPVAVEFKLRSSLTDPDLIRRMWQPRAYCWALGKLQGNYPAGIVVDERLNEAPKPPRIVKAKRKGEGIDGMTVSHATNQVTTPELYAETCRVYGDEPRPETLEVLRQRRWHQQVEIIFRPGELEEAGRDLVSAARLIGELDRGEKVPVRNAKRANCSGCRFNAICANPTDEFYVDTLFTRDIPKRDKGRVLEGVR
jgi:hypothetical protein